jgi:pimeloyl-ACP methyl ester carboxylesterase
MRFVLIHGGTFDERCWDRLIPLLDHPVTAVRQPGRSGFREDELGRLSQQDYRDNVAQAVSDLDDDLVLVGHSLAGISIGAAVTAAGDRAKHVVLLSAVIPPDGVSVLGLRAPREGDQTQPAEGAEGPRAVQAAAVVEPDRELIGYMDPRLSAADANWAFSIAVAESSGPVANPVAPGTDRIAAPITWVRLMADTIFPPELQTSIAERVGAHTIVDLDAGHLAMISRPAEVAAILNGVAASND